MREKGVSPPPKPDLGIEDLIRTGQLLFRGYIDQLDKWLRRLVDATAKIQTTEVTISPAAVSANTTSEQTFTVNGLTTSDIVYVNKPTHQAGLGIVGARCSAANTLAITFGNFTGSGITPTASQTYLVVAIRR